MNTWEFLKETVRMWRTREAPKGGNRDPKKIAVKRIGQAIKDSGGSDFEDPTIDLEEISRAYHTDSYIKRAVDKYADLMFKNGWDFSGKNDAATEYVWMRMKLMAEATDKPIERLLTQAAFDMVLFGNAYIVKQRRGQLPQGVQAQGYKAKQPVLGYFVLPPTTIRVARDEFGKIVRYEQETDGGQPVPIKPEDMIHVTYKQPSGRAYGIPFIYNVMDDVKMLRQIEENVARLIYRNLFPLYLYQVGIDKPGFEATDEEIEEIREQIRDMPMDGGIVLPERHNIKVVGTEGAALDAEPYLKYFRQRVFTGLGMSDSVMGVGDTSNRSTSDNQAADLFDGVKDFQRIFAEVIQFEIINELLFEGGFDPVLNPDDEVTFAFHEIELDAKTKKENHIVQLFSQNAITHEEMRQLLGLDPVVDESRLHVNMFGKVDSGALNQGDNKDQPENQHGKQKSPGKPKAEKEDEKGQIIENLEKKSLKVLTEDNEVVTLTTELQINTYTESMKRFWNNLRDDVIEMTKRDKSMQEIRGFTFKLVRQSLRTENRQYISSAMMKGFGSAKEQLGNYSMSPSLNTLFSAESIVNMSQSYVNRLLDDMSTLFDKAGEESDMNERVAKLVGAFNSNEYRLSFIAKTELYRAYNYGIAIAAKQAGLETVGVESHEGCDKCLEKQNQPVVLTDDSLLDKLPPHHPNCTCIVKLNMPVEEV